MVFEADVSVDYWIGKGRRPREPIKEEGEHEREIRSEAGKFRFIDDTLL